MDAITKSQLCDNIANIIKDYRELNLDSKHVSKWINQFEDTEQEIVLRGTLHLFKNLYIQESIFNQWVKDVFSFLKRYSISNYSLLEYQINGGSQKELNRKFIDINQIPNVEVNKQSKNIIYLDDFIFTGNRIFNDIQELLVKNPNFGTQSPHKIYIITLGLYSYGKYQLDNRLKKLVRNMRRNISFKINCYKNYILHNNPNDFDEADIFTFHQNIPEEIKKYLERYLIGKQHLLIRKVNQSKFAFKDFAHRDKFEEILIRYGIEILEMCGQSSLKPLGFGPFQPGFGATVFTYRNCPNNAPLVYWWGSLTETDNPALRWYPLLPRTTYAT